MTHRSLLKTSIFLVGSLLAGNTLAGTVVTQHDDDTLLVTRYEGKPPHQRQYINQDSHPELYAHYEPRIGVSAQPLFAVESRGVPGKTLPSERMRVSSDRSEIVEFARLEEVEQEPNRNVRRWRGAPGKQLRLGE